MRSSEVDDIRKDGCWRAAVVGFLGALQEFGGLVIRFSRCSCSSETNELCSGSDWWRATRTGRVRQSQRITEGGNYLENSPFLSDL